MKANEAPKKLYFGEGDKGILDIYSDREPDDEIEYTRTDAFVKKACDAFCKICKMPNCWRNECVMIDDFKGYLKNI